QRGAGRSRRASHDRNRSGDWKCDFRCLWRTSAPPANPPRGRPAGAQHPKLTLCYQLDDRRKLVGDNSADEQRAARLPGQIGESLRKRARRDGIEMLKLPPPIWALVYVLTAAAISWFFGWSKVPGLPLAPLGISLVAISWILPVWAIVLFRREGTEVEPTSPTNRKLITSG